MAHKIVELISVKPAGGPWFSDVHPEENNEYLNWVKTVPGVVFIARDDPDENTIIRTFVFEDGAAYDNYVEVHKTNEWSLMKQKFNDDNGIVITVNVLNE